MNAVYFFPLFFYVSRSFSLSPCNFCWDSFLQVSYCMSYISSFCYVISSFSFFVLNNDEEFFKFSFSSSLTLRLKFFILLTLSFFVERVMSIEVQRRRSSNIYSCLSLLLLLTVLNHVLEIRVSFIRMHHW